MAPNLLYGGSAHVVSQHKSLSYFNRLLPSAIKNTLANSTEITLFLPQDSAWGTLHPVERLYLESEFADDDIQRILNMHSMANNSIGWSDTFKNSTKCELTPPPRPYVLA